MIRTLAWKEYREHRAVWVAMAGLIAVALPGLTLLFAPGGLQTGWEDRAPTILTAALSLAAIYGLVCGAMMLAGESEARTLAFLDALPARRVQLWLAKLAVGTVLALAQGLLAVGVIVALDLDQQSYLPASWKWALPLVALEAFAYGLFGSALGRSVLAGIVWATIPLVLAWIAGGPIGWPPDPGLLLTRGVLLLIILAASALIFCRPDLQRWRAPASVPSAAVLHRVGLTVSAPSPWGWMALLWLTYRQGRVPVLILAGVGFVLGLTLPRGGLVVWPLVTLLAGTVCGTGMFLDEQTGGFHRFLGDQRLPMGRVWTAKLVFWSLAALGTCLLVLLGAALHVALAEAQHGTTRWGMEQDYLDRLLGGSTLLMLMNRTAFLVLWLSYGFAIGQLYTLVWRKSAVIVVVALLVSGAVASVWVPSLIAGGVAWWQVLVVPVFLLLATRLVMWAWVSDRLRGARAVAGLFGCGAVVAAWIAGTMVYRAVEVPDVGEPFDVPAFAASVPSVEKNRSGRLIRQALEQLAEREKAANAAIPRPMPQPRPLASDVTEVLTGRDLLIPIPSRGWPADDAVVGPWLDVLFEGEWAGWLREAAGLPLGVVEDPTSIVPGGRFIPVVNRCRDLGMYLTARALQRQARGDPAEGLAHLADALALARNLRSRAVPFSHQMGRTVEGLALEGLDRWLEALGPDRKLLRRALDELNRHEQEVPPLSEAVKAEYLVLTRSLTSPSALLESELRGQHAGSPAREELARLEAELAAGVWQVPWERDRYNRILNALYTARLRAAETDYGSMPSVNWASIPPAERGLIRTAQDHGLLNPEGPAASLTPAHWGRVLVDARLLLRFTPATPTVYAAEAVSVCRLRGARLKVALALCEIDRGKPAEQLDELAPAYLAEPPRDPFSGKSYRYRLSKGDTIEWWSRRNLAMREGEGRVNGPAADTTAVMATREIPEGQGILWSVGPDRIDHGGTKQGGRYDPVYAVQPYLNLDIIFLVPYWKKP